MPAVFWRTAARKRSQTRAAREVEATVGIAVAGMTGVPPRGADVRRSSMPRQRRHSTVMVTVEQSRQDVHEHTRNESPTARLALSRKT